jgi:hypothetical protein
MLYQSRMLLVSTPSRQLAHDATARAVPAVEVTICRWCMSPPARVAPAA